MRRAPSRLAMTASRARREKVALFAGSNPLLLARCALWNLRTHSSGPAPGVQFGTASSKVLPVGSRYWQGLASAASRWQMAVPTPPSLEYIPS